MALAGARGAPGGIPAVVHTRGAAVPLRGLRRVPRPARVRERIGRLGARGGAGGAGDGLREAREGKDRVHELRLDVADLAHVPQDRTLGVRGESTEGRVASAAGPDARRRPAGDVYVHRRGPPTTTRTADCRLWRQRRPGQMGPRPGRGRAGGAVPRSRFRRNPKGAWVLLGSALVRLAKVARPRMRASLPLLLLDDPHRDRLRRRAL